MAIEELQPYQRHVSVGPINQAIRQVNALEGMSGDEYIHVQHTGQGRAIVGLNLTALLSRIPRNAPFLCVVTKDGGVAGSDVVNCSYTYTVKGVDGHTLGTLKAPQVARYPLTAYLYAGESGSSTYGLAAYDGGTLLLLAAFGEIPDTTVCVVV